MADKKKDYNQWALDPIKPALVQPNILADLQQFVGMVKQKHTSYNFPQQVTWYNKKTHEPIDSSKKISDEKLKKEYYQNIDLGRTENRGAVVYDELALSAIKLTVAFEEVFRLNVDEGNAVKREQEPVRDKPTVQQPTLVTDES